MAPRHHPMEAFVADIVLILTMVAFFVVCAIYVSWCDRIIGPDPEPGAGPVTGQAVESPGSTVHADVPT